MNFYPSLETDNNQIKSPGVQRSNEPVVGKLCPSSRVAPAGLFERLAREARTDVDGRGSSTVEQRAALPEGSGSIPGRVPSLPEASLIEALQALPRAVHFCAWCQRHFCQSHDGKLVVYGTAQESDEPISHGICPPCRTEQEREFERLHLVGRTHVGVRFALDEHWTKEVA